MTKSFIKFSELLKNIDDNIEFEVDYILILPEEYNNFINYVNDVDSSIIGIYKFLNVFNNNYSFCPSLVNICKSQYVKIIDEIDDWKLVDVSIHKGSGLKVSKTYSFFLEDGVYQVDDHFVYVEKL